MGQNLILNLEDHGYTVCVYNRTVSKVDDFLNGTAAKGRERLRGAHSIAQLIAQLKRPRRILLMVKAGEAVDEFIEQLVPHLQGGDIIIDGGNSHFEDTERRCRQLKEQHGLLFVGCGVSGGEEGARYGPSLMPGGASEAWPAIREMFQAISAKADGVPCCEWVGEGGSGHFVKMVHNGIEYGDMQLICEAYHLLRDALSLSNEQMAEVFAGWNSSELNSFLISITHDILLYRDPQDATGATSLLDRIRDAAGQKGTGRWTVEAAMKLGTPITLIAEAVFARSLSAMKEERVRASAILPPPTTSFLGDRMAMIEHVGRALYIAKLISYAQGFMLFRQASQAHKWKLNMDAIAGLWRGGCIIRSAFLSDIQRAFRGNATLENLLFDPFFQQAIERCQSSWRRVVAEGAMLGIPMPALSAALSFYDGYRTARLPANLLQAQRDYFGAHTFEYLDRPGEYHHVNWTGQGGSTTSTTYQA